MEDLFETMSIEEIKQIIWKTRRDIENKKEELRMLVGERYRDIIETADTISEMKSHSQQLSESLNSLSDESRSLHRNLFLSSKGKQKSISFADQRVVRNSKGFVAAQLKMMLDIPEMIHDILHENEKNCLLAAQHLLLGKHVASRLILLGEPNSVHVNATAIIQRQNATFYQQREAIVSACVEHLTNSHLDKQKSVHDLLAMAVLQQQSSTVQPQVTLHFLIKNFLNLRKKALEEFLKNNESEMSVKNLFVSAISIILSSIDLANDVFVLNGEFSIKQTFHKYEHFSLKDFSWIQSGIYTCLHDSLLEYKPIRDNVNEKLQANLNLGEEECNALISEWLTECVHTFNVYLNKLLVFCITPTSLGELRLAMNKLLFLENIDNQMNSLLCISPQNNQIHKKSSFNISILQETVKEALLKQMKAIFSHNFGETFMTWRSAVDSHVNAVRLYENAGNNETSQVLLNPCDYDMSSLLWCDVDEDYVRMLSTQALFHGPCGIVEPRNSSNNNNNNCKDTFGLSLQWICKLYSPTMKRACLSLNKSVREIASSQLTDCSDQDSQRIQQLVRECLLTQINDFLTHFKNYLHNPENNQGSPQQKSYSLFILSRYLICFFDLCSAVSEPFRTPNLSPEEWTIRVLKEDPQPRMEFYPEWIDIKSQVFQLNNEIVDLALQTLAEEYLNEFQNKVQEFVLHNKMMPECLMWSSHEIVVDNLEEEDHKESGAGISKTYVHVPSFASINVHKLFMGLCNSLSSLGGHVLTKHSICNFQDYLCRKIVAIYQNVLQNGNLGQSQALQLLFDTRFVFSLLSRFHQAVPADLVNCQQSIQEILCSAIDPFDLEVCAEPLREHLQSHLARCQQQYAFLSAATTSGTFRFASDLNINSSKTQSRINSQEHNILHMLKSAPTACSRFMLLPVATNNSLGVGNISGSSMNNKRSSSNLAMIDSAVQENKDPLDRLKANQHKRQDSWAYNFFL